MAGILEETLFDYLKAHPEDMDKQEYKQFENTDPMGEMFYYDVAEIIALGIVENRDGKVPGGNLQEFITRIASDIEFRKTLLPIAEKLKDELAVPVGENGQREQYSPEILHREASM